ncbi:MAG: hypothetical protein ACI9EV_002921 [Urechidicola sp.]|mgnify:CR=1 FL=1|jgi:hypothetical protein
MSKQLVTVIKNSGERGSVVSLEVDDMLSATRVTLIGDKLMTKDSSFLLNGNPLDRGAEATTPLSLLLDGKDKLYVGGSTLAPLDPEKAVDEWNSFGDAAKNALFNQINIHHGLIMTEDGFSRSYSNAIPVAWDLDAVSQRKPATVSKVTSDYTFSKTTKEMITKNVQTGSVTFTAPFASANAEFEHSKETSSSEEHVTTYLISKFIAFKIGLQVEAKNMKATTEFMDAVKSAILEHQDDVNGYSNLMAVLDKYGYYVPSNFSLGGALLTESSTQIDTFADAQTEMDKYSFGFSAAFDGIGGGAAYSNSDTSTVSTTSSNEYSKQTFQQIGGESGTNNDYAKWIESLASASNWDVATYDVLIPTIALIGLSNQAVGNACYNLITKYSTYDSVKDMQTMIDMNGYAKAAKSFYGPKI